MSKELELLKAMRAAYMHHFRKVSKDARKLLALKDKWHKAIALQDKKIKDSKKLKKDKK